MVGSDGIVRETWSALVRVETILVATILATLIATALATRDRFRSDGPPGWISRAEWTRVAPDTADMVRMNGVERITLHHEGASPVDFRAERAAARRLERIRRHHRRGRGWADIAYHFVIDRAGRVWEARDSDYQGAHAGNFELNRHNLGVMLLGNFDEQEPATAQLSALAESLAFWLEQYDLTREDVFLHSDLRSTECPGEALTRWFQTWKRQVAWQR